MVDCSDLLPKIATKILTRRDGLDHSFLSSEKGRDLGVLWRSEIGPDGLVDCRSN